MDFVRLSLLLGAVATLSAACSSDEAASPRAPATNFGNAAGAGSSGSGSGSGSSTDGTGTGTGTSGASSAPNAGSGAQGLPDGLNAGNACGVGKLSAKLSPVNMLVMFDRSRSMLDEDKWPNATAALSSFFANPSSAGMRVALRFFPHDSPAAGCSESGCDAEACAQPLVPIASLLPEPAPQDSHEGALLSAITSAAPSDGGGGGDQGGGGQGTPIYAALDGSLRWAASDKALHPEENTVVIFVTDGEPNGCDENFDNISALASDALAATGVTTYAIGLQGSNESQMDQLAQAGGTDSGIFIGNSANAEQDLLAALDAIRGQVLTCDFAMPQASTANAAIDPAKVNVTFTSGAGMAGTLGQVPDAGGCGTTRSWHYDVPQAPSRIVLCPAACELVQADPNAQLEILLGCETACGGLDVDCGGDSTPPPGLPPVL